MIPFYTNSESFLSKQTNPYRSIGGHISNSIVRNGIASNIFGNIPFCNFYNKKTEYRLIAIKNTVGDINNLNIYIDIKPNSICNYKLSFVSPTLDSCNSPTFELIPETGSKPYSGSEFELFDINNKAVISSFALNDFIGVWIERTIDPEKSSLIVPNCSDISDIPEDLDSFNKKNDEFDLIFEW